MLDHVSLSVTDPVRSQAFFTKALAPLGYKVISQFDGGFGIGAEGGSAVWAAAGPAQTADCAPGLPSDRTGSR